MKKIRYRLWLISTFFILPLLASLTFGETRTNWRSVPCDGDYRYHLQGICTDKLGSIFWSFTDKIVKTNAEGTVLKTVDAAMHHGDLCYADNRIYVAVNHKKFNQAAGSADSWVYEYSASNLKLLKKYEIQDVVHGAGGIAEKDGHFFVIGGLPEGVEENYVYEYDKKFKLLKRHIIRSGYTLLGIQTIDWHDGAWWVGCYGKLNTKPLIKTDSNFNITGRYEFYAAEGISGIAPKTFLIGLNSRDKDKRNYGLVKIARVSENGELIYPNENYGSSKKD